MIIIIFSMDIWHKEQFILLLHNWNVDVFFCVRHKENDQFYQRAVCAKVRK